MEGEGVEVGCGLEWRGVSGGKIEGREGKEGGTDGVGVAVFEEGEDGRDGEDVHVG